VTFQEAAEEDPPALASESAISGHAPDLDVAALFQRLRTQGEWALRRVIGASSVSICKASWGRSES
jgi:hypothetical protein